LQVMWFYSKCSQLLLFPVLGPAWLKMMYLYIYIYIDMGRAVAYWLRHYATNQQVVGSIPDGVIGIFQWHNTSGCFMALGSTQPLTEMSTRCISWG
jgi:hypothetical protein